MSLIGNIVGIPVFTTKQEALAWATSKGLSGYHVHSLQGQKGYMGGASHHQATGMPATTNAPSQTARPLVSRPSRTARPPVSRPIRAVIPPVTPTTPTATPAAIPPPASGGGGGGY